MLICKIFWNFNYLQTCHYAKVQRKQQSTTITKTLNKMWNVVIMINKKDMVLSWKLGLVFFLNEDGKDERLLYNNILMNIGLLPTSHCILIT